VVLGRRARPLDRALARLHPRHAARGHDMRPRSGLPRLSGFSALVEPLTSTPRSRRPHRPSRLLRKVTLALVALVTVPLVAAVLFVATALFALRAAPGEWAVRATLGPIGMQLSVPALIRVATHPLGIRALAGHGIATRLGLVRIAQGATPSSLVVRCAPCVVDSRLLAAQPLRIAAVELTVEHGISNQFHGEIRAGAVAAPWRARLESTGTEIEVDLPDTPVAAIVALFGATVPEASRAHVEGRAGGKLRIALPSLRYAVEPRIEGLAVDGLGTDALLAASPTPDCARAPRAAGTAAPFGTWLPRAVVAAEDQRFFEHAGYDVAEMAAAWSSSRPEDRADDHRRGASTLSQQLAKLLYTGDEPSAARKVRELMYAVELDRTLGKARVLQLYLAIAPWGDGQCGGEAAALHYFGRHAATLSPVEAVWLASLLRNPRLELDRAGRDDGDVDVARLAGIVEALRPVPRWRRDELASQLAGWTPPPVVQLRAERSAAEAHTLLAASHGDR
jgi:hypothetical protein